MKNRRIFKRALSVLLAVAVAVTLFTAAVGTFSAANATLSYSFSGAGASLAGYAQGICQRHFEAFVRGV